jgi:hypothetical protein
MARLVLGIANYRRCSRDGLRKLGITVSTKVRLARLLPVQTNKASAGDVDRIAGRVESGKQATNLICKM